MIGSQFSVILLPTNKCNVACDYCFEDKTDDFMSHDQLAVVVDKLLDHMERRAIASMTIYWQGGEIMMIPPRWFERAYDIIASAAARRGRHVGHSLQSNMIGYSRRWNPLIAGMFGNSVGTSMDFPNLYRHAHGRSPEDYTSLWVRNVRSAREAGIDVGVISIPNRETLRLGAERFYSYFVDELGVTSFQVNTAFSGGEASEAKAEAILDVDRLAEFFVDLARVWFERGRERGIALGPFDELLEQFSGRTACLPCIWRQNCTDEFVSIDARGNVAQCDCWVTSSPEYSFGNILGPLSFTEILSESAARKRFEARPEALMRDATCFECEYLSVCHGGCPVRTLSITGEFFVKDPYCAVYKALFACMDELAARDLTARRPRSLPVLRLRQDDPLATT